ncbi:hypothetical protein NEDG_00405 [Nematocida displodere]|uniref:Uncharacterized protein n=1 Tax=Nematocida displodere TaxID=1805483 RepID=A0A177EKN5_9MICR|nr:hypothetical protein NEDG_00405 [Nematocida displodere]
MFFCRPYLARNSLLSRMFILSCARTKSATMLPISALDGCIAALYKEHLSLRLWSRLALALSQIVRLHYRQVMHEALRFVKKTCHTPQPLPRRFVADLRAITLPFCFKRLLAPLAPPPPGDDTLEYPRAYNTSMLSTHTASMLNTSFLSIPGMPHPMERHTARTDRVDCQIDISPGSISLRDLHQRRKAELPGAFKVFKSLLAPAEESLLGGCFPSELDISSIEYGRRCSTETGDGTPHLHIPLLVPGDIPVELSSLSAEPILHTFISLLSGITEGRLSGVQFTPYNKIWVSKGPVADTSHDLFVLPPTL